ncbi:MAG: T9SS type A sorting domain-containing protein [Vicingaceae bacterium]|nr:T9SS type A sorting domain-containing protein [Vicingaceae bacterium]
MKPQTANSKLLILLLLFTLINVKMNAQYQYLNSTNSQLRHIFSQITYPNPSIEFLNERSAKLADSTLYQINNPDTIHQMQWYQVYKEMYYAAHDTLTQVPFNDLMVDANNYGPDTIPIGIMDWQFYRTKYDAIHTPNYFVFDTVNNYFFDHPTPLASPFTVDNLFMSAPLIFEATFLEVTFAINPDFIFVDGMTTYDFITPNELQIDFGDGNGFVTINPTTLNYITVQYPTNGEKVIQTRLLNKRGFVEKSSTSRLFINKNSLPQFPNSTLTNIPGMTVGVYSSCQDARYSKKIILVEGFDPMDEIPSQRKGITEIYHDHINMEELQYLRNFGYDYYVVDWKDSKTDMRFNALNLMCLIEYLKSTSENDQEFVIIGVSMGGVIARFTLNYMESLNYQILDLNPFLVEAADPYNQIYLAQHPLWLPTCLSLIDDQLLNKKHNTRLLITVDSPHQGANIPLAYQNIYRFFETSIGQIMPGTAMLTASIPQFSILQLLNKKAPRQLLKWYAPPGSSIPAVLPYAPAPSHVSFFTQLKTYPNNGTPTYAKMLALSDGALDGSRQQDPNTNLPRNNNDAIVDFDLNTSVKILWIPFDFINARVDARTNPNGYGLLCGGAFGHNVFTLKVKFFKIKITTTFIPTVPLFASYATNTQPTCVTAGGNINIFDINNSSYNGNWNLWGGFLGFRVDMSLESNGTGFCFVPTESALDYNGNDPYNNDILNEDINAKLANTPFDVMAGQVVLGINPLTGYPSWKNHSHTANRNDESFVFNLTQQDAVGPSGVPAPDHDKNEQYAYYTCAAVGNYEAKRTFLAQEIGDEELYLENFVTNRTTTYRTEFDIKVNHRNPYYEYPSQPFNTNQNMLFGVYSKEDDFDIASGGFATFYYDSSSPSTPSPGLDINYLNSSDYTDRDEPYGICCTSPLRIGQPIVAAKTGNSSWLTVYPNPTQTSGWIAIDATFSYDDPFATITVTDLSGKQLFTKQLNITAKKLSQTISVAEMKLAKGVYLIQLTTNHFSKTNKLIIY